MCVLGIDLSHSEMAIQVKQTKMLLHRNVILTLQHVYKVLHLSLQKAHMDSAPIEHFTCFFRI